MPAVFFGRSVADGAAAMLGQLAGYRAAPYPAWPDYVLEQVRRGAEARGEVMDEPLTAEDTKLLVLDRDAADEPRAAAKRVADFVVAHVQSRVPFVAATVHLPAEASAN